jgi:hypothetical protein
MNRYTALFAAGEPSATPGGLRKALEVALSENQPAGAYRLGSVAPREDGQVAAELACSMPRETLSELLAAAGKTAGYTLDRVGWGWLLSGKMAFELVDESSGDLLYDPFSDVTPQDESARSYRYGRQQAVSLAVVLLGALFALGLALGYLVSPTVASWTTRNLINLVLAVIIFWMVLRLIGATVTPWSYLRSIEVDEDGITLRGLLQPTVKAAWHEVDELELADRRALLLLQDRVVSFPILDRLGMNDHLILLRTIIQRASLYYVGGRVGNIKYRKFDA